MVLSNQEIQNRQQIEFPQVDVTYSLNCQLHINCSRDYSSVALVELHLPQKVQIKLTQVKILLCLYVSLTAS